MKSLHVRNMPDGLYERVQLMAKAKNRSLNAQIIILLAQAMGAKERRVEQIKVLASIQSRRLKNPVNVPDSLKLLREDRER